MTAVLPILLVVHVSLAITLFVPSILLPFTLRGGGGADSANRLVRALSWLQARGAAPLGVGLLASGLALVAVLGWNLLGQPWLIAALGLYAINLGIAFFVQRPGLRQLVGRRVGADAGAATWTERARRQRYLSYAMGALVGTIGFLMTTKPELW